MKTELQLSVCNTYFQLQRNIYNYAATPLQNVFSNPDVVQWCQILYLNNNEGFNLAISSCIF